MQKLTKQALKEIPVGYGIYKVFVRDSAGKSIAIRRFAELDLTGLIYIGRASKQHLKKRLANFEITCRENSRSTNHSGAMKYKKFQIIRLTLGEDHELYFEYIICENPELEEKKLLDKYREDFGDSPLLNG